MTDEQNTRAALDAAITAHAADELLDDGEVIVAWVACAAVLRHDGGGVVITMPGPGDALAYWQMRGILGEALASVNRQADRNATGGDHDQP